MDAAIPLAGIVWMEFPAFTHLSKLTTLSFVLIWSRKIINGDQFVISLCVQDWKTGDRVLAKWQDCKFYPAKIAKCLSEGKTFVNL